MLTSLIAAIALVVGIALPHSHTTGMPAHSGNGHVSAFDGSGGGPPIPNPHP